MKQMGLAVMMYKGDYDETFPPVYEVRPDDIYAGPGGDLIQGDAATALSFWNAVWGWQQLIYPYTKSVKVGFCPSSSGNSGMGYMHYGANVNIIGYTPATDPGSYIATYGMDAKKDASVSDPAGKYLLMDFGYYQASWLMVCHPFTMNYLPGEGQYINKGLCSDDWQSGGYGIFGPSQSDYMNARHSGGVCVAYADGHAKWQTTLAVLQSAADRRDGKKNAWDPAFDTAN
jgi:prepilin-type processing-associated H-X9-DG protein